MLATVHRLSFAAVMTMGIVSPRNEATRRKCEQLPQHRHDGYRARKGRANLSLINPTALKIYKNITKYKKPHVLKMRIQFQPAVVSTLACATRLTLIQRAASSLPAPSSASGAPYPG